MTKFLVKLKSLERDESITLAEWDSKEAAEHSRSMWRRALGGNRCWIVNRRPGLDTVSTLALTVEVNDG